MHFGLRFLIVPVSVAAAAALTLGASSANRLPSTREVDSAAVANVVDEFHTALSSGDSSKALGLLADDAVILESGGVESRSEYRSHHLPEDIKFARAVTSERAPIQVRTEGSIAWTFGTSTTRGEFNGRAINSIGAESMVLTKGAAGWRIRSIHWSSRNRRPAS